MIIYFKEKKKIEKEPIENLNSAYIKHTFIINSNLLLATYNIINQLKSIYSYCINK